MLVQLLRQQGLELGVGYPILYLKKGGVDLNQVTIVLAGGRGWVYLGHF